MGNIPPNRDEDSRFHIPQFVASLREALQHTLKGERHLNVADVRQYLLPADSLPEGTFSGELLAPAMAQTLRSMTGVPEREPLILAYSDCLLGCVIQCAVLTPRALYGAPAPDTRWKVSIEHVARGEPTDWHVVTEFSEQLSPKFRPRFAGFLEVARDCVRQALGSADS
jgi:hypothetical protein